MIRSLQTVAQFASDSKGAFTEAQIRWWVHKSVENGMAKAGAIVRVGRRVYLDPQAFDRWLTAQNAPMAAQ